MEFFILGSVWFFGVASLYLALRVLARLYVSISLAQDQAELCLLLLEGLVEEKGIVGAQEKERNSKKEAE